ncbi:MAG: response regulator [Chthoniobacteraceae bacterium]
MPTDSRSLRVLHLEDSPSDAGLIHARLDAEGLAFEVTHVASKKEFEGAVDGREFDLVLCDYNIPGYDGLTALKYVRQRNPVMPVLLISGLLGEDEAVRCLQLGATDYIIKDRLSRLGVAVRRALDEAEEHRRRRRTEEALRASEERFRLLVENSSDLVCEASLDGCFLYLSPNFHTMLGYDFTDLLGTSIFDKVHPDDLPRIRAKFGQPELRTQFRYRHANGSYRWFEITGRVFATADGRQRAGIIGRDITERRVLEEELRQSQKMESIGQLAGGVAHDFNNILTVILGQASLLACETEMNREARDSISEITEAANRAATLTRQLLTFSRKQVMQPRDLDLNSVVNEMTRMLRRTLGDEITLAVMPASELPLVHADHGMMEQILLNLAVNARDAMPDGGRLEISTSAETIGLAELRVSSEAVCGPAVCLRVSDCGTGIAPEVLPRIFEPFFTTKDIGKGTGLGLASVHGIVRQHRGWIKISSEMGRGTDFRIYLPAQAGEVARLSAPPMESSSPTGKETVLIVDDDPAVRQTGGILLRRLGYNVIEATSGVHAIEMVKQGRTDIDLLLTDMMMPGGIGGKELAETLRQRIPGLRVLYSSGYSVELAGKGLHEEDQAHFLQKPYSAHLFAQAVHDCLQG